MVSKLVTDYHYTDGMLFDSEEPLNDILLMYSEGLHEEDFIELIARPLKHMENTIRRFHQMGNKTEGENWNLDELKTVIGAASLVHETYFENFDVSKLNF